MPPNHPHKTPSHLSCPVCFDPLESTVNGLVCPTAHTFDRAREGYVNLLLANQKGSSDPGDDRVSVEARRAFLDAGHYTFLSDAIIQAVGVRLDSRVIADAGCSEGYHLNRLSESVPGADCTGVDISRSAIRLASRKYPAHTWVIANIARRLPLADTSCDILLSVLAPRNAAEFQRVLNPKGLLIVVIPGDRHLGQLTDLLMAQPSDQTNKPAALTQALSPMFDLESTREIQRNFCASRKTISDLVAMTPLRWKSRRPSLRDIENLDQLELTACFRILCFRRGRDA